MTRSFRLICCAAGAVVAFSAAGCGSMSRLIGGKSSSRSRSSAAPASGSVGSFIAAVDTKQGTITFRPEQAATAGKARTAAQQYGPGDRLALSGTATYAAGVLSGNIQLVSTNGHSLNDVRVVVTSISDTSVNVANADGTTSVSGTERPYWDHGSLDPPPSGSAPTPSTKLWAFNNPGAVSFTFRVTVFANVWNYNGADSNPNLSVSFPDAMHGWMVGTGGKLLCTKDGGVTWEPQNLGTGAQLEGVYFVNQFDGWVVGSAGTIRRTGDGGRTWYRQNGGTTFNLRAVRFVGPTTGWIVGDNGLILKTTNAGQNWTQQANPAGEVILYAVDFANANVGWAVGQHGTILHTSNGGDSWSLQAAPGGSSDILLGVCARDTTRAWVCGSNGRIWRTTNGLVWTQLSSGVSDPLEDIFFINSTTGWAVGGRGLVLKSTDGGNTWEPKFLATSAGLFAVRFTDANNGWVAGQEGTLLRTTDGGENWPARQQGVFIVHHAVDFPDRNHGWIVGESGLIRATSDGGRNWTFQNGGTVKALHAVRFTDANNGWVVGQDGTIRHTSNGGQTWTAQTSGVEPRTTSSGEIIPGENLLGVDFIDPLHGCIVGTRGTILYTANGGATWEQMLNPDQSGATLTSVDMVDGDLIYACGQFGRILFAYDVSIMGSAAPWERLNVPYLDHLFAIRMVDANTGWAVGQNGRVLRTVDGGVIWDAQREENGQNRELYAAEFLAIPLATPVGQPQRYKYVGWVAGTDGRMFRTTDAGVNWTQVDLGTINHLRGMRFTDPDSGWVVGAFGTVQHLN